MKLEGVELKPPKTKSAALNQAAYITDQIQRRLEKGRKLMETKDQISRKIARLQTQLEQIQTTMSTLDRGTTDWQKALEGLKLQFNLTESEILETKSQLLRKQIAELQRNAGIQDQPAADKVLPEG